MHTHVDKKKGSPGPGPAEMSCPSSLVLDLPPAGYTSTQRTTAAMRSWYLMLDLVLCLRVGVSCVVWLGNEHVFHCTCGTYLFSWRVESRLAGKGFSKGQLLYLLRYSAAPDGGRTGGVGGACWEQPKGHIYGFADAARGQKSSEQPTWFPRTRVCNPTTTE